MKRGVLVYNPSAGQRDLRQAMVAVIERMRGEGLELVNAPTEGPGHATEIVRAFVARGAEVVAVCGGDGTVSEAASGVAGTDVPLGVLPGGTSNVLARELEIPIEMDRAAELLTTGRRKTLHVFTANDRPFLLWAGVGLDARVMARTNPWWKRQLGRAGIALTALSEFAGYEFPRLEVSVDGEAPQAATFAVACHARRYAGDWIIAPEASLLSDRVEVLVFSGESRRQLYRLFQGMRLGDSRHLKDSTARLLKGREVSIRSLERYAVEAHADGDAVLETPVSIRPVPDTVAVLVP